MLDLGGNNTRQRKTVGLIEAGGQKERGRSHGLTTNFKGLPSGLTSFHEVSRPEEPTVFQAGDQDWST